MTRVFFVAVLILFICGVSHAIPPPRDGHFPRGFWEIIDREPSLNQDGDPGWVKKMNARKQAVQDRALDKISLYQPLPVENMIVPVLMGKFSDNSTVFNADDIDAVLWGSNPTGSLTDYFKEVSYNQFVISGDVHGWYSLDYSQSYYVGENYGLSSNFPNNSAGFVYDLAAKADPSVDFSQYDNDGPDGIPNSGDDDGYVDAVTAVHSGKGSECYEENNNLWSCKGSLGSHAYITNDSSANGGKIKINTYVVCPELNCNEEIVRIGVFAHEFGHVLGLPDLYDRTDKTEPPDYEDSEGIGNWCLMAGGCYGGDGSHSERPAHISAWCKLRLGWVTPTIIKQNVNNLSIRQIETYPEVCMLWEDGYESSRYFLLENRQKMGFDIYLSTSGLLVYHVDEQRFFGPKSWSTGANNDDEHHKLVDIEEADGNADMDAKTNRGDAGDPFPGTSNNRLFNASTNPNSNDYADVQTGIEIRNISNPGTVMTADVMVRSTLGYTIEYDEYGLSGRRGWSDSRDTWSGMLFSPSETGILKAVDLGFYLSDYTYELAVYDSFVNSKPGNLLASVRGVSSAAGWFTVELPSPPIIIKPDKDFFVSVKVENVPWAISYDVYGEDSNRSYYSTDGINFYHLNEDVCIRARIDTSNLGILAGLVTDVSTEKGLENAAVSVSPGDYSAVTDGSGSYRISGIPAGNSYTVTAARDDYISSSVDNVVIDANSTTTVNIALRHVNRAPVISAIPDTSIYELESFVFHVEAEDPDGDSLTCSLTEFPEGMVISPSGVISWTPDYTRAGKYSVTVKVEDSNTLSASVTFILTVLDVDRAPVIVNVQLADATQDMAYADTVRVEDPDEGDVFTYTMLLGPQWLMLGSETGVFLGVPSNDDVGSDILLMVEVTDSGGLADTLATAIDVLNVLDPPLNVAVNELPSNQGHRIHLTWDVSPDDGKGYVSYYRIYRSRSKEFTEPVPLTEFTSIDSLVTADEYYPILIDSVAVGIREYTDENVPLNGVPYYYWLQAVGADNASKKVTSDLVTLVESVPGEFRMESPFPNPCNLSTTIAYSLPCNSHVTLQIYNVSGQVVCVLRKGYLDRGNYTVLWNASGMPSGIYFCTLRADQYLKTEKILLLK
ncbi:M6 family metalloprotease domain-containing protein [bacterium]|nr:M6 family metalloprotease domain-containing protein [bacterium]